MSETKHKNVWVALCAAQAEMGPLVKGSDNPHFKSKYADLADLVMAVRGPLTRNGLTFAHQMIDGPQLMMRTVIVHGESDTRFECDVPLIVQKNDMQGMKSATTYAKRIGLESVTGIAPEDDDGNAAAKAKPTPAESATNGLRDAWKDGVLDGLPADASERDKAEAFAAQIEVDFRKPKTQNGVNGVWSKREQIIGYLERKHPDLHANLLDAFKNRMDAFAEPEPHEYLAAG